jgi:hypothetical protein
MHVLLADVSFSSALTSTLRAVHGINVERHDNHFALLLVNDLE